MEKEFNLSEKIQNSKKGEHEVIYDCFYASDIKEFIKRREKIIQSFLKEEISCPKMWTELNKLAGDKI